MCCFIVSLYLVKICAIYILHRLPVRIFNFLDFVSPTLFPSSAAPPNPLAVCPSYLLSLSVYIYLLYLVVIFVLLKQKRYFLLEFWDWKTTHTQCPGCSFGYRWSVPFLRFLIIENRFSVRTPNESQTHTIEVR